jgi:hypothetical protein
MADKLKAILEINPNAKVEITNDEITNWYDTTPISDADILAKMNEIDTRDAHITPRQKAYPSIEEQLDMMYKDQMNDTTTWKDAITKVKTDNPKASE